MKLFANPLKVHCKLQGQRAETEVKIQQKRTLLESMKDCLSGLQATNSSVKQRNDKAAATLEATLHITSMLPQCMGSMGGGVSSHPVTIESSEDLDQSDACMTGTSAAAPKHGAQPTAAANDYAALAWSVRKQESTDGGAIKRTGVLLCCDHM